MGESAGGGSIMHQITAYGGTEGSAPFQRAIPQSPGFQPIASNYETESIYTAVLQYASLLSNQTIATIEDLREASNG
jgi:carboxylesterase type B